MTLTDAAVLFLFGLLLGAIGAWRLHRARLTRAQQAQRLAVEACHYWRGFAARQVQRNAMLASTDPATPTDRAGWKRLTASVFYQQYLALRRPGEIRTRPASLPRG